MCRVVCISFPEYLCRRSITFREFNVVAAPAQAGTDANVRVPIAHTYLTTSHHFKTSPYLFAKIIK